MSDVLDNALVEYIKGASQQKTGMPPEMVAVMAEAMRARSAEKIKGMNILNSALADQVHVNALGLAATTSRIFGAPLANIMPYPPSGPVNTLTYQIGAPPQQQQQPAPAPAPIYLPAPQPAPPAAPVRSWKDWIWPLVAAGLLGTTGGLAGYLLAGKDSPLPATEIDPNVGIEIDG
jgi:hypothetical protein